MSDWQKTPVPTGKKRQFRLAKNASSDWQKTPVPTGKKRQFRDAADGRIAQFAIRPGVGVGS
jgi:hypothetical protein